MKTRTAHFPATSRRLRGALVVYIFGVCAAGSALAHDITDAMLTQRSANCADYAETNTAKATDVLNNRTFDATVTVTANGSECVISSNAIPNHDFNATGRFATPISEQDQSYTITAAPTANASPTALTLLPPSDGPPYPGAMRERTVPICHQKSSSKA